MEKPAVKNIPSSFKRFWALQVPSLQNKVDWDNWADWDNCYTCNHYHWVIGVNGMIGVNGVNGLNSGLKISHHPLRGFGLSKFLLFKIR